MDSKSWVLLLLLVTSYRLAESRNSAALKAIDAQLPLKVDLAESTTSNTIVRNENLCDMCEQFTAEAITYLAENKTQMEIIDSLHKGCSRLHNFKQQCAILVDYYTPLFFVEINTIQPEQFCEKVNLCEGMKIFQSKSDDVCRSKSDDVCTICHHVMDEVIVKLNDPDTQLEIIEMLLKECKKVENHVAECKKLVFQYGPLILADSGKFLETNDICAVIHGCQANLALMPDQGLLANA